MNKLDQINGLYPRGFGLCQPSGALEQSSAHRKRQGAGAVQDAGAMDVRGARRSRRFSVRTESGADISCVAGKWTLKRAEARAPAGLEVQGDPFPALKRRAIFRLSLRDKVVCANFILVSIPDPHSRREKCNYYRACASSKALLRRSMSFFNKF